MAVVRISVKDQIYKELKERIRNSTYGPGDRLNIDNIARELEVSNSPVREAINMLVKDGLLQTSVNMGPRVIQLTGEDIAELNQAVYLLLLGGFDICQSYGRLDQLENELKKRIEKQEVLLKENEITDYISSAIYFDRAFVDVTENSRLVNMYDSLADIFYLSVADRLQKNILDHRDNMSDHLQIIGAVQNRDRAALIQVLKQHYHEETGGM